MPRYLTSEWFDEANEALDTVAVDNGEPLTIEYEVTGAPDGKVRYRLVAADGAVRLEPGAGEADAQFATDYATAVAIATGQLPAQAAFMQGALKLTGNTAVLIAGQSALNGMADVLGGLRERTEF